MNKYILPIIIFQVLFIISCGKSFKKNEIILNAESIINIKPDSAYTLLSSIKKPRELSNSDFAAWCLQYTHAQYKLYIDIKSDSLIKVAINYYESKNDKKHCGTAYYLLGCILELNEHDREAILAYKKAEEILSTILNTDLDQEVIKAIISYRISNLFLKDEYYIDSEKSINKAIILFRKLKDYRYLAYCHRIKVEIQYRQEKPISEILKEADICQKYAKVSKSNDLYNNMLAFRGKILIGSDINKAKITLLKAYKSSSQYEPELLSLLTYVYAKLCFPDSAKFYKKLIVLNKNDQERNLLSELSTSYILLYENKKDSAFICLEKAYNLREKIYEENIKEQLVRIDKQYDLSKKEAEKAQLAIRNQKNVILIAFLSITILAVLLILLVITNINKKRQSELIIEKQQLEFEVKTKQVENEKKLKVLLTNLQNKIDNTLHFKKLQLNLSKTERKEEFIAEITRQSTLTDKEWQFYIDEANELFDGKIEKLKLKYPQLTNADMIVISLICIGIDITNSILLLDYSNINTMYIRRNRIKKHLGLDKSTDLENWLRTQVIDNMYL